MLRLNKLLLYTGNEKTFHERIMPTVPQHDYLVECKNKVRDHLFVGITQASKELGMERSVSPRFRTQGSWAYKTCIQRAHATQEMDWDFGVYLPVTVFEDQTPKVAARTYFALVERLLADLCRSEGWRLNTDNPNCIRIHVAKWAHLDVPLYAAAESEFEHIRERVLTFAKAASAARDVEYLRESVAAGELVEAGWEDLQGIHLATRDGTWKRTDPEAVNRWFTDQVAAAQSYGDQMRRVCRYEKAWRDLEWPTGGPSSVSLMIATAQDFRSRSYYRDDLALESAARHLASVLLNPLYEPSIDEGREDFFGSLTDLDRGVACAKASALADGIEWARGLPWHRRQEAIDRLRSLLGDRIPNEPDLVEIDGGEAEVRATAASIVPRPLIKATEAG